MTGPQTLWGAAVRRASACLAVLVVALVVAPVAAATPEGDADAAITATWQAAGGPTGPLGAKDGGVYPVGAGFGQNLAGGRIYFTPEAGAHIMQGAILDKYLALGGPADGDLGFPNIDEGGGKAPDSRNTTFSAADKPVIFWTPDTGAHVVRGAINAAWDKLGGSGGSLGVPVDDETYDGDVVSQAFAGGRVSWDHRTKAFTTAPPELADQLVGVEIPGDANTAINAARRAAGGPLGPLGAPDGEQYPVGGDGIAQKFAGGKIFYTPATGANVVMGQILAKYESLGGPDGDLGLPSGSETDGGLDRSRVVPFSAADQPVIFWTPDYGAVVVRGAMNAAWTKLGGATSQLGAPTSDQVQNGDGITQTFAGGAISWDQATKKFSTEPPSLASSLSNLQVPGAELPKKGPAAQASPATDGAKWYTWRRSYWVGVIPAAMLIVAIGVALFLNRRRRKRRARLAQSDPYMDAADGYDDDYHGDDHAYSDVRAYRDDQAYRDDEAYTDDRAYVDDRAYRDGDGSIESGPIALAPPDDPSPVSAWATPVAPPTIRDRNGGPPPPPPAPRTEFAPDEDFLDTEPTHIESEVDENWAPPSVHSSGPPSGRHAAIQLDEPGPALTSLRLALEDPYDAPSGYPIKADTKTGLYWTPDSNLYGVARAEIWFASEEFALTNGFTKG
jgi:uncharacterized protein with LGFP repeats